MNEDGFEWDDVKAISNAAAHGVTFEAARGVFRDPFALDWSGDREDYGEERYVTLGMADGRLLFVVYTERRDLVRIISARGAEPHEKRRYLGDRG